MCHWVETVWVVPEGKHCWVHRGENFASLLKTSDENIFASVSPRDALLCPEEPEREKQGGGTEAVKTKQDKVMKCLLVPLLISCKMPSSIRKWEKQNFTSNKIST